VPGNNRHDSKIENDIEKKEQSYRRSQIESQKPGVQPMAPLSEPAVGLALFFWSRQMHNNLSYKFNKQRSLTIFRY
jgi:hypothetical protein